VTELTIFGTAKPFTGPFARIQRNALWSWAQLRPEADVLVIGDDTGSERTAREFGLGFVESVRRSPRNVPLLDDLWAIGQREARTPHCVFSNCDLIFTDDLLTAMAAVSTQIDGPFLLVGQRWDLLLDEDLPGGPAMSVGERAAWGAEMRGRARRDGTLNSPLWVDWFGFPTGQYESLPACAVGRPGYDHWLVWHTLRRGIPVVDASDAVTAIHQHHDYSHGGTKGDVWHGPDAQRNLELIEGRAHMRMIGNATHRLDASLRLGPARGLKYTLSRLHRHAAPLLEHTAPWRHRWGIDAEALQRVSAARRRARPEAPAPRRPTRTQR
jgi:hypothetical protein